MNLIVVGCGRVGSELASRIAERGHRVAVVDNKPAAFHNLPSDFSGRIVEGEALDRDVLHRAGIKTAHGLAAVTSSDSINAVVAHLARVRYHIPNIIVLNYEPKNRPLFDTFDLQVVSSALWGAQRIEELLYHQEIRTVFSAGNGEVEVYEFTLPQILNGRAVSDLLPASGCSISALTRSGKAVIPAADTILQGGDVILVSATIDGISALRQKLIVGQEV